MIVHVNDTIVPVFHKMSILVEVCIVFTQHTHGDVKGPPGIGAGGHRADAIDKKHDQKNHRHP
jgi:hypothetical protein